MTWPPEGSKPPVPPRPAPAPKPRPERPSRLTSPGETEGETKVKPQAKAAGPTPPQFGHEGIDPLRALLILGLPLAATAVTLLVLFASPLVWWIAAGVTAAGVLGGVALRRTKRGRSLLNRLSGGVPGRRPGLRRMGDGRFARSPLGRVFNRALGRRPAASRGGSAAGAGTRPKGLGGRLRSALPSWAGGTRPKRPGGSTGGSSGGSRASRFRSMMSRLKPGGRRPGSTTGGALGGRPGRPGGTSPRGSKTPPKSRLGRAANATGRAARAVGTKLFGIRPKTTSPSRPGGSRKPNSKGKTKAPGGPSRSDSTLDLGVVWTGAGKAGRLVGRGIGALFGRLRRRGTEESGDDLGFEKSYEIGIEGEVVDGVHTDSELGEIAEQVKKDAAKRARKLAKKRAREAKEKPPEWPNVEPHDGSWPAEEPEDGVAPPADPPARSLPAEQDYHPPPSHSRPPPPRKYIPPPHHEAPRITSANTGGRAMSVSPTKYNDLITNATSRHQGWQAAADAFRRDSAELDEKAKEHDEAARIFRATGNQAAAEEREDEARKLRDDGRTCMTYAARMQEKANEETAAA